MRCLFTLFLIAVIWYFGFKNPKTSQWVKDHIFDPIKNWIKDHIFSLFKKNS